MENIHVLEAHKPSLLHKAFGETYILSTEPTSVNDLYKSIPQNIYVTSDEEIKEGDWVLNIEENTIFKPTDAEVYDIKNSEAKYYEYCKKIILTTDQELIADGVQAIDDEFLEWFVKNSSCEEVEVERFYSMSQSTHSCIEYKIIIPKEEPKKMKVMIVGNGLPKQETLEEAAERLYKKGCNISEKTALIYRRIFFEGAKWHQERSYSEGVICKHCKKVISVEHINSHLFMAVKSGGLIHWNCKTI